MSGSFAHTGSVTTSELLPCPFCGGPASFGTGKHKYVACRNEDCFGPMTTAVDPDDAAAQWNTRAMMRPLPAQEQRPFGHYFWRSNGDGTDSPDFCEGDIPSYKTDIRNVVPLYAAPVLSPAESVNVIEFTNALYDSLSTETEQDCERIARAILSKLKVTSK